MGPRARARGNAPSPRWPPPRCTRFNGATSARSWKWPKSPARPRPCAGLQWGHERALVEIPVRRCILLHIWRASMGPRARARGNVTATASISSLITLQWGHERALVEMWWEGAGPDATTVASMGPRARARGNGARIGGRHAEGHASMGPRARARGNATQPVVWRWKVWLQWGHARALVEI